jgi:hypothetical protein
MLAMLVAFRRSYSLPPYQHSCDSPHEWVAGLLFIFYCAQVAYVRDHDVPDARISLFFGSVHSGLDMHLFHDALLERMATCFDTEKNVASSSNENGETTIPTFSFKPRLTPRLSSSRTLSPLAKDPRKIESLIADSASKM